MRRLHPAEKRTADQLRQHYETEKELAGRLRRADRDERSTLYAQVYDELFRRVPNHPQWTKRGAEHHDRILASQLRLLKAYLNTGATFLEVGAGDCALSLRVAPLVGKAYALEVSEELTRGIRASDNFQLLLSDGRHIPLPDNSVDVAYSFQLMEHIHPDDAFEQLREVFRVLKPGGIYHCTTPNRLSGPHDISRYFDDVASGLHLREYSIGDLVRLFRHVGFQGVWAERLLKSRRVAVPRLALTLLERSMEWLPASLRRRLGRSHLVSRLLDAAVIGRKAS